MTTIDPPTSVTDPIAYCIQTTVKEARKKERVVVVFPDIGDIIGYTAHKQKFHLIWRLILRLAKEKA